MKKVETIVDPKLIQKLTTGSGLQGVLKISFGELTHKLGGFVINEKDPKTDIDWALRLTDDDGLVYIATIYNYKDGPSYLGNENGKPMIDIMDWNVGGFTYTVVPLLARFLNCEFELK